MAGLFLKFYYKHTHTHKNIKLPYTYQPLNGCQDPSTFTLFYLDEEF